MLLTGYIFLLLLLVGFSWGFVDANLPFATLPWLYRLVYHERGLATLIYSFIILALFGFYLTILRLVKKQKLTARQLWLWLAVTVIILLFSYPAFSNDVFNYIATAKVTFFYQENPYLVMPIEIPNEPMLKYLHAANKVALYGPAWIILTGVPHLLGRGNILASIFTFKIFVALFYAATAYLIWRISQFNLWSLAFFAFNPLVVVETLVSGHNDVVMMFWALFAFFWVRRKRFFLALIFLLISVLIKLATLFLLPVFTYLIYLNFKRLKVNWPRIWRWSALAMYLIFLLSPLREEIYAWYLIWPLTFVALIGRASFLSYVSLGFSLGLMFRFAPFIYTRNWGGITPLVKKLVTIITPLFTGILYAFRKKV